MSDIRIVDQPIEEKKAPIEEPTPPDFEREGIFLNERVAELFNMGSDEARRDARKIETLIEYAKAKSDDHSPDGVYWALKQLGLRLGTPPLGEKMIDHAYMYARLYMESLENKAKREQLLKGDVDGNS